MKRNFEKFQKIKNQKKYTECVAALSSANAGDLALDKHLPSDLRKLYAPERVLSRCSHGCGCVLLAKQNNTENHVAIKVVTPVAKAFKEEEMDQLKREGSLLTMFSETKFACAARIFPGTGQRVVEIYQGMSWFIMELLQGERMDAVIYPGTASGAARDDFLQGREADQSGGSC